MTAFLFAVLSLAAIYYVLSTLATEYPRMLAVIDALFAGTVASLCVYSLVQFFSVQKETYSIQKWLNFKRPEVLVTATSIIHVPEPKYGLRDYYVVPPFDAQAAGILTGVLRMAGLRYPVRRTIGSHRVQRELLEANIVSMCLPTKNAYSRIFLGLYHEIYVDHGKPLQAIDNWQRYSKDLNCDQNYLGARCCHPPEQSGSTIWQLRDYKSNDPNCWKDSSINIVGVDGASRPGQEFFDYGIVVKGPNPFNNNSGVLIVAGIHGMGTLGAALYVYQNSKDLFMEYTQRPQYHLVRVTYTVPFGGELCDAEVVDVELEGAAYLNEIYRTAREYSRLVQV